MGDDMQEVGPVKRVVITMLAAIAGGGAAFFICMIALIAYAELRYKHPGSMTGVWAFYNSVPFGAIGGIVSAIVMFMKLGAK